MSDRPQNIDAPPIELKLAAQTRLSEGSLMWVCPVCIDGALLMRRDPKTLELTPHDRCTLCGQQYFYVDIEAFKRSMEGK